MVRRDIPCASYLVALALAAFAGPAAAACLPERVLALDPGVAPLHVGTQSFPSTLALKDREIVLTFDDGPAPATTSRVLAALKAACVHATFFLVGRRTAAAPELARREHEEGHGVGHHSDTHPAFTLRGFDAASAERDIQNGIEADEVAVYGKDATPDHPHEPFFRFPGFADTPALLAYLDRRGIAAFGSDLWAADWLAMSPDAERRRILAELARRPGHNGILLLHDTVPETARMLPALLADLKAGGYTIVHVLYAKGSPAPALTAPRPGEPEAERVIEHLPRRIVEGSHHLGEAAARPRRAMQPRRQRHAVPPARHVRRHRYL